MFQWGLQKQGYRIFIAKYVSSVSFTVLNDSFDLESLVNDQETVKVARRLSKLSLAHRERGRVDHE